MFFFIKKKKWNGTLGFLNVDWNCHGRHIKGKLWSIPCQTSIEFIREFWRVWSTGPMKDNFLVGRTRLLEDFLVVGVVQVPPNAHQMGWNAEALQSGGCHTNVMQLGQNLAVEVTEGISQQEPIKGYLRVR